MPCDVAFPLCQQASPDWIKVNKNTIGYYRVNYDADSWETLAELMQTQPRCYNWLLAAVPNLSGCSSALSGTDKAGLLSDAYSLVRAGSLDVTHAFNLTSNLVVGAIDHVDLSSSEITGGDIICCVADYTCGNELCSKYCWG